MANGNGVASDLLIIHETRIQNLESHLQKVSTENSVQTAQLSIIDSKIDEMSGDVKSVVTAVGSHDIDIALLKDAHDRSNNNKTWIISAISGAAAIIIGSLVDLVGHFIFHIK